MTIAEAIAILEDEYGTGSLLDNLEKCLNDLTFEHPEQVPANVRRAYRIVMAAGRKMFAPA